ncbi:hypothetical protein Peur_038961 [Populus x canadensis]
MTSLIVWDEAPMNNKCCIEALDRSLKDVLTSSINAHLVKPFGGKSVLGSDPISLTVSYVYPGIDNTCLDPSYFKERAAVTTKNATVDEINHFALSIVPGEEEIYLSTDSVCTTSSESDYVDLLYP